MPALLNSGKGKIEGLFIRNQNIFAAKRNTSVDNSQKNIMHCRSSFGVMVQPLDSAWLGAASPTHLLGAGYMGFIAVYLPESQPGDEEFQRTGILALDFSNGEGTV